MNFKIFISKIILASTIVASTQAAISKIGNDSQDISNTINSLKNEIRKLDLTLGAKNKEYINTIAKRQQFDVDIYESENQLSKGLVELESEKQVLNQRIKQIVLSSLSKSNEEVLRNKILINRITKQRDEINLKIENKKRLQQNLVDLKFQYQKVSDLERQLYSFVNDLEIQKNEKVKAYLEAKDREAIEKSKISEANNRVEKNSKLNEVATQLLNQDFEAPIKTYLSKEFEQKGITFSVKDNAEIYAAKDGVVIHSGVLANYGNVIIIDHGNEVRSIYLGDLTASIAKDAKVKANQVIGKIRSSIKKDVLSKLYFEIRNKNKVQNTIKLVKLETTQV